MHPMPHPVGRRGVLLLLAIGFLGCVIFGLRAQSGDESGSAETRAVNYLLEEVPRWVRDNQCFSCHNDGDGARALYLAHRLDRLPGISILERTTDWLKQPEVWENNKGDPGFSDKRLAHIQFSLSLLEAHLAGLVAREKVLRAARLLLAHQAEDGAWPVDVGGRVGSPTTYGTAWATAQVIFLLRYCQSPDFEPAIRKATDWLLANPVNTVLDAAAVLTALTGTTEEWMERREHAVDWLKRSQKTDGGWGAFPNSPPEPFDTAVALLSLKEFTSVDEVLDAIRRGRAFLQSTQLPSGGWPETTRPPGAESYAQHLSTTGWAARALLETASWSTGSER